jgi:hypothetical protein
MTLRLDCVRRPTADEASDDLRISVTVIKGDRGTVAIHDAAVQLSPASGPPFATVALHSLERQSYRSEDSAGKSRKRIRWDKHSSESPFLNLSPGEEMTFGAYHRIPSTDVCRVEAIVLGKRTTSPAVAQWRGSAFVLPLTPKERRDAA